ncbi:MAG: type II toxin-antitoxin system HicA family toxin [Chloroflexi bacterium]|nr:type II toxin-antitoxin system HicA family toxin [Chloroflexota bacterium]
MISRLPRVTADEAAGALERAGFGLSRQSGSHKIYENAQRKRVTIPYHRGKVLHPKVLRSILDDADLSLPEFQALL